LTAAARRRYSVPTPRSSDLDQRSPFAVGFRTRRELLQRALEQPQTDHVGQRTVAAAAGSLVRDAGSKSLGPEQRRITLEADERPGARAEEEIVAVRRCRHRVVRAGG